jgi:hypothetical protein
MRASLAPTARPVANAVIVLVAAVLVPLAMSSTALAERWLRPVSGEVARPFLYARAVPFRAGAHRGVDLVASPGTAVGAACGGRVIHAGPVAGQGRVVSMRCGSRRVSYLPLARVAVRAGSTVRRGASIGTVAGGHGGLHLGVRREGDPFAYVDPIPLLEQPASPLVPVPPAGLRPRPPTFPRGVAPREPGLWPRPTFLRAVAPRESIPPRETIPRAERAPDAPVPPRDQRARAPIRPVPAAAARSEPAPWLVWAGLGLLLTGAAGSGTITVRRRRHDRRRPIAAHATR